MNVYDTFLVFDNSKNSLDNIYTSNEEFEKSIENEIRCIMHVHQLKKQFGFKDY